MDKKAALTCIIVCLSNLIVVQAIWAQHVSIIYINSDGSVLGTNLISREGNLYRLTSSLNTPIILLCNNVVLDGEGYTLQGKGGWGIPGALGVATGPAINITASNVVVRNFIIYGWQTGILGAYNNNTIQNNSITTTSNAIAIYAHNYNISANYLAASIYALRIKGNNNFILQNKMERNYGGILMSSSTGTTIVGNSFANNGTAINIDDSNFTIYQNNFYLTNSYNTSVVSGTLDALGFNVGIMPIWDNGKVGNYWSDYKGIDQNGDGIGDLLYTIRVQPQVIDRYPLMSPVSSQNITQPLISSPPTTSTSETLAHSGNPTSPPFLTTLPSLSALSSPSAYLSPSQQPTKSPELMVDPRSTLVICMIIAAISGIIFAAVAIVIWLIKSHRLFYQA